MPDMMNKMDIAFPNLGLYLENVPQGFTVFGFYIALYGIMIGLGVVGGVVLADRIAKKSGQNPDIYWDFLLYALIFSIVGARTYYVIFEWDSFKDDLLSIFNLRNGGIAIYGAVIGAFITLVIFCKVKKQKVMLMADTAVPGLILGQIIGRWGNYFNREVFGEYSDGLLAMRLPVEAIRDTGDISESIAAHMSDATNYIQVHPTFLYEALLNLIVLIVMLVYWKHRKFNGEIFLIYLGGYGIVRFFVEGIRTDQLLIPGTQIAVSQLLGIILFVFAIVVDIAVRVNLKRKSLKA